MAVCFCMLSVQGYPLRNGSIFGALLFSPALFSLTLREMLGGTRPIYHNSQAKELRKSECSQGSLQMFKLCYKARVLNIVKRITVQKREGMAWWGLLLVAVESYGVILSASKSHRLVRTSQGFEGVLSTYTGSR